MPGVIKRSPGFRVTILAQMEDIVVTDEDGSNIAAVKFGMDRERAERFIIRVAKGLQKHYFPDRDGHTGSWRCAHIENRLDHLARIEPLIGFLPYFDSRGDEVIQYRFGFTDDRLTCIWLMVFYDSSVFVVMHQLPVPASDEQNN